MCGIVGFKGLSFPEELESNAVRMASALAHRGPDDAGVWADKSAGVALAHRQLWMLRDINL
ncbi:MAG: hypothetical protein D3924_04795 [Candidatus Electrothrix sp. AR4]|nr:hypothetical protein [Candidatus Electrothrix sp. AR4]